MFSSTSDHSVPFGAIIHNLADKYDGVSIADIRKIEKVAVKARKAELDLNFFTHLQDIQRLPKVFVFSATKHKWP